MGVENHDIETVSKLIGSAAVDLDAGLVPAGMKRYVTFVRVDNVHGGKQKVYIASAASAAYSASAAGRASAAAKLVFSIEADEDDCIPPGVPDVDHPLFSIAAGKYIGAATDRGGAYLFLQYYDR